ncbi:hypothetical protein B0T14DRAFT_564545 [Immersiella caudata]|uniref:Uncharacterized protein n=1 Tax=Immersiella caudata TaxID=314043 RepID=A0AA40C3M5_9PEZI|nr:hypothetical protein B0T14DRAFT_564545 [Immersiella caudata]
MVEAKLNMLALTAAVWTPGCLAVVVVRANYAAALRAKQIPCLTTSQSTSRSVAFLSRAVISAVPRATTQDDNQSTTRQTPLPALSALLSEDDTSPHQEALAAVNPPRRMGEGARAQVSLPFAEEEMLDQTVSIGDPLSLDPAGGPGKAMIEKPESRSKGRETRAPTTW